MNTTGYFTNIKKYLVIGFCLLHMIAISWWTLPQCFGGMVLANNDQTSFETKLFQIATFNNYPGVTDFLQRYIDATGSQQYWDFFAPHSPKYHQYLSVCGLVINDPEQGKITCEGKPLFSNLDDEFNKNTVNFRLFGSDRSRFYRLTENLVNLGDANLLNAFASYYQLRQQGEVGVSQRVQLVLHQFELHPELKDLPKAGYRMDKVLLKIH